jgi:DNA adenine methylase
MKMSLYDPREPIFPFLKWPGGKRWLAPHIVPIIKRFLTNTYYEPFLGGGAVFFHLRPPKAVLSDVNEELINTYVQVKIQPKELVAGLRQLRVTAHQFDQIRNSRPKSPLVRAIRMLYLNRTAFAGMYRVNRAGIFNAPYAGGSRTPSPLWKDGLIERGSGALANAKLSVMDFEKALRSPKQGDVVYCDPTYVIPNDSQAFRRYNDKAFSWTDHQRLASAAKGAAVRGAAVLISSAFHPHLSRLYADAKIATFPRHSCIARHPEHRRQIKEAVVIYLPRFHAMQREAHITSIKELL